MDEARTLIRRLERIEALQSAEAPAQELLAEVRQLLAEGESWLAAERGGAPGGTGDGLAEAPSGPTEGAEAALEGFRAKLMRRKEVMPQAADSASL